jgi:arginase
MSHVSGTGRSRGLVLVEVPFNSAGLPSGVARMPSALSAAGLPEALGDTRRGLAGVVRVDVGDLEPVRGPSGFLAEDALVRAVLGGRDAVRQAWRDGHVPLLVAGDCPVLIGPLLALRDAGPAGLVFLDGHEDAWPPELSPSGEAADSEMGLALGRIAAPAGLQGELPCVEHEHVVMLGPRDAAELQEAGCPSLHRAVRLVDGATLDLATDDDAPTLVRAECRAALDGTAGWWLHIDLDVLSNEALPAVDYPQPGGIGWERLELATRAALTVDGCRGASVVIYNPDLDRGAAAPRIVSFLAWLAAELPG